MKFKPMTHEDQQRVYAEGKITIVIIKEVK
jgi:hypothetical protein